MSTTSKIFWKPTDASSDSRKQLDERSVDEKSEKRTIRNPWIQTMKSENRRDTDKLSKVNMNKADNIQTSHQLKYQYECFDNKSLASMYRFRNRQRDSRSR